MPDAPRELPPDDHVHTQWSWDAPEGDMAASCRRAIDLGLPAIAFTEHVDHTVWRVHLPSLPTDHHLRSMSTADGDLRPPPLDVAGYLDAVAQCRERFPSLRIRTGVELGEPHRHATAVGDLLAAGRFDRVLGSLHTLPVGDHHAEPPGLFAERAPEEVLADYLDEIAVLADSTLDFEVLAHIDYPLRSWPQDAPAYDLGRHEDRFRHALGTLARSGRALELNTRLGASRTLAGWWREEGGRHVSVGSDAHRPDDVARDFAQAARVARACGFEPGATPYELWRRA